MNGISYAWLRGVIPSATLANSELVCRALQDVYLSAPPQLSPGGTIYKPGRPDVYYPAGAEGDSTRMAGYMAMDAMTYCLHAYVASTVKADGWLAPRSKTGAHASRQLNLTAELRGLAERGIGSTRGPRLE